MTRDGAAVAARLGDVNDTITRLIRLCGQRLTDLTDFADRRGRDLDAVIDRINDRQPDHEQAAISKPDTTAG
jgi:hypothetical protein